MQVSDDGGRVLRIRDVTEADAGHYWCEANNAVGAMSTTFTVHVTRDAREVRNAHDTTDLNEVERRPAYQKPRTVERPRAHEFTLPQASQRTVQFERCTR